MCNKHLWFWFLNICGFHQTAVWKKLVPGNTHTHFRVTVMSVPCLAVCSLFLSLFFPSLFASTFADSSWTIGQCCLRVTPTKTAKAGQGKRSAGPVQSGQTENWGIWDMRVKCTFWHCVPWIAELLFIKALVMTWHLPRRWFPSLSHARKCLFRNAGFAIVESIYMLFTPFTVSRTNQLTYFEPKTTFYKFSV